MEIIEDIKWRKSMQETIKKTIKTIEVNQSKKITVIFFVFKEKNIQNIRKT
jgi:hypothetical protein